jgi:hypothetical protein
MALCAISLFSCEEDDVQNTHSTTNKLSLEKVDLTKGDAPTAVLMAIENAREVFQNSNYKTYRDSVNDLLLDDRNAYRITSGEYESYTIPVIGNYGTDRADALMLTRRPDSTYAAVLAIIHGSEEEIGNLLNPDLPAPLAQTYFLPITNVYTKNLGGYMSCTYVYETRTVDACDGERIGDSDCVDENGSRRRITINVVIASECTYVQTPVGFTEPAGPPGSPYSGGGSPSGSGSWPNIPEDCWELPEEECFQLMFPIVMPYPFQAVDPATIDFFDNLDSELSDFINGVNEGADRQAIDDIRQSINAFLIENSFSDEALGFTEEAIRASEEGLEVTFIDPLEGVDFSNELVQFQQHFRSRMSPPELVIFDQMSSPEQLDYLSSAYMAEWYMEWYYDNVGKYSYWNGIGDAFRHAYWNAASTWKLGSQKTEELTTAHEDLPTPPSPITLENEMDLHNNQLGRNIGGNASYILFQKVKWSMDRGLGRYLSPLNPSGSTTNTSTLVPTEE